MSAIDTGKVYPPRTTDGGLVECLMDVFSDREASDVTVVFCGYERDEQGNPVLRDDEYRILVRELGIPALDDGVVKELKKQYDKAPLLSLMILWRKQGKVGILKFKSVDEADGYEEWEEDAITNYANRRNS